MRPRIAPVPIDRLRELFDYDPNSGLLAWKSKPSKYSPHIKIGEAAGCEHHGYIGIKIDRQSHYAHRIIWAMMTGAWPENLIDHKDLDGLNNKWENLREANYSQNGANSRPSRTTLPKGVYAMSSGRFFAVKRKNYRYIYLGSFDTQEEAHQAYMTAAVIAHGEFARSS